VSGCTPLGFEMRGESRSCRYESTTAMLFTCDHAEGASSVVLRTMVHTTYCPCPAKSRQG
jgi:hypothetical protein